MEVQMAATATPAGRRTPTNRHQHQHHTHSGGAKPVPSYLRPPAGSCHHVCKYGGAHAFEEKPADDARGTARARAPATPPRLLPRRPLPQAPDSQQTRVLLGKVRSVFRRRAGESAEKASKAAVGEGVEWKDIVVVAYGKVPARAPSPQPSGKLPTAHRVAAVTGSGDARKKKKDAVKVKQKKKAAAAAAAASYGKAATVAAAGQQVDSGVKAHDDQQQHQQLDKSGASADTERSAKAKPPKGKKPSAVLVGKMAIVDDQETLRGYQALSPSLPQSRADLLRDLEKEMMMVAPALPPQPAAGVEQGERAPAYALDQEESAAAAVASSRPIPAHRRAKSMGMSSRSVRYPFARQASNKSSGVFKLRSRSTKAPVLPPEEEERPAARARSSSRRGDDASGAGTGTGRGIQLRIRSLRRRGVGGSGGAGAGFVVPAVALRHQKTLEKKKSQRLYNNMIEETATKLAKARKSRVKALVGAFESVISKIAK